MSAKSDPSHSRQSRIVHNRSGYEQQRCTVSFNRSAMRPCLVHVVSELYPRAGDIKCLSPTIKRRFWGNSFRYQQHHLIAVIRNSCWSIFGVATLWPRGRCGASCRKHFVMQLPFRGLGFLGMPEMTDDYLNRKLDELDHLLNDPNVPLQPDLIWSVLDEVIRARRSGCRAVADAVSQIPAGEMATQGPRPSAAREAGPSGADRRYNGCVG